MDYLSFGRSKDITFNLRIFSCGLVFVDVNTLKCQNSSNLPWFEFPIWYSILLINCGVEAFECLTWDFKVLVGCNIKIYASNWLLLPTIFDKWSEISSICEITPIWFLHKSANLNQYSNKFNNSLVKFLHCIYSFGSVIGHCVCCTNEQNIQINPRDLSKEGQVHGNYSVLETSN